MHDCTVTATNGQSDLDVIIVGHAAPDTRLPRLVEAEAAAIATGDRRSPSHLTTDDGRWLLIKPEDKAWLVGSEAWRVLGARIAEAVRASGATTARVHLGGKLADAAAVVEGILLGDYLFTTFRSGKAATRRKLTIRMPGHTEGVAAGTEVAVCQNLARDLIDQPPNKLNPATFVAAARKLTRGTGLTLRVIQGIAALDRANFPGLVQVGQAGSTPPALVVIRYRPRRVRPNTPNLALVGKGITFDTGGISLKPGDKMWEMKADMAGAASVLGAMLLIAKQRPAIEVTGYLALAENMPDSKAQRPGDIYKARNGLFIHVDNTDAEGRLVLADVLTYAAEQGATHIADAATLTGACLVALGDKVAGILGRHSDFTQLFRECGRDAGEDYWELPLHGEYRSMLDHPHADINNIGGRFGGTITAGIFLSEFVPKDVKWVHTDIAGPAMMFGSAWRSYAKGATGFGVRTFARLAGRLSTETARR